MRKCLICSSLIVSLFCTFVGGSEAMKPNKRPPGHPEFDRPDVYIKLPYDRLLCLPAKEKIKKEKSNNVPYRYPMPPTYPNQNIQFFYPYQISSNVNLGNLVNGQSEVMNNPTPNFDSSGQNGNLSDGSIPTVNTTLPSISSLIGDLPIYKFQ